MNQEQRAAISLNNTGVALLHRRCYHQGLRTLCDAIAAMKIAGTRTNKQNEAKPSATDMMLYRAAQRLAQPDSPTRSDQGKMKNLQVVCDDQGAGILAPTSSEYNWGWCDRLESRNLLRIEPFDDENSYNVRSSIILYNLGLAHLCIADLSEDVNLTQELRRKAMYVFTLSYSILCIICKEDPDETCCPRFVLAATNVLHNLIEMSFILGLQEEFRDYVDKLDSLRDHALETRQWITGPTAAGAA